MKKLLFALSFFILVSPTWAVSLTAPKTIDAMCTNVLSELSLKTVSVGVHDDDTFFIAYDKWTVKIANKNYKNMLAAMAKSKKWLATAKEKKLVTTKTIYTSILPIDDFRKHVVVVNLTATEKDIGIGVGISNPDFPGFIGVIVFMDESELTQFEAMLKSLPDLKNKLKEKMKEADELLN